MKTASFVLVFNQNLQLYLTIIAFSFKINVHPSQNQTFKGVSTDALLSVSQGKVKKCDKFQCSIKLKSFVIVVMPFKFNNTKSS